MSNPFTEVATLDEELAGRIKVISSQIDRALEEASSLEQRASEQREYAKGLRRLRDEYTALLEPADW